MIRRILFILLVLLSMRGFSQTKPPNLPYLDDKRICFGICMGFSNLYSNMVGKQNLPYMDSIMSFNAKSGLGLHIGIISDLKLLNFMNLKFTPMVSFSERGFEYLVKHDTRLVTNRKNMEIVYVEMPLELNIKSKRWRNMRPYLIAGLKYTYDAGSIKRKKLSQDEYLFKIEPNEIFYTLGMACDFYLTYFKLGIELKTSFGINDILNHDYHSVYSDCVDRIRTQVFYVNFNFSI